MTQKVSITMSDELHARLNKVRDKFNISSVCQEAIEREVRIHELAADIANDESVFERIKLQKAANELTSEQMGKQDGAKMTRGMSYLLIGAFEDYFENLEPSDEELSNMDSLDKVLSSIQKIPIKERMIIGMDKPIDEFLIDMSLTCGVEFKHYLDGFTDSVYDFQNFLINKGLYLSKEEQKAK